MVHGSFNGFRLFLQMQILQDKKTTMQAHVYQRFNCVGLARPGLSATTQQESPFSVSEGVVSSSRYNKLGHMSGSAGANPGDSGGGCFDSGSCLVGINVGCENVPISLEKDTGAQIYDKISSRYAARAHIIPIIIFQSV